MEFKKSDLSANHTSSKIESTLTSTDTAGHVSVVGGIEKGARLPTVPEFQMATAATLRWAMSQAMAGYFTGVYQHIGYPTVQQMPDATVVAAYHEWSSDPRPLQYCLATRFEV